MRTTERFWIIVLRIFAESSCPALGAGQLLFMVDYDDGQSDSNGNWKLLKCNVSAPLGFPIFAAKILALQMRAVAKMGGWPEARGVSKYLSHLGDKYSRLDMDAADAASHLL